MPCEFPGCGVGRTRACILVDAWVLPLLKAVPYPVVCFWGVYGFGMALASLYANVQGCAPVLLRDWCGASGTEASWLLGGAWS